jgi:sulfite dehydrogenase (cytochrome) subunit B
MKKVFLVLTLFTLVALIARAGDRGWKLPPETTKLERGPGVELATAQCLLCHSADYISIQPPMSRAAWAATVTKMKDKYGAPLVPDSTNGLVNYLVKTYGTEKTAPDKKQ